MIDVNILYLATRHIDQVLGDIAQHEVRALEVLRFEGAFELIVRVALIVEVAVRGTADFPYHTSVFLNKHKHF